MIVLGIDQGRRSGWGIVRGDHVVACGSATTPKARLHAVRGLLELARHGGWAPVAVLEDHSKVPMTAGSRHKRDGGKVTRGTAQLLGMGDARGRWLELLALHGVRSCMVSPGLWRPAVLGIPKSTRTDPAKAAAVTWATRLVGSQGDGAGWSLGEDECEALAIAWWGSKAPQVAELAAMRRLRPLLKGCA